MKSVATRSLTVTEFSRRVHAEPHLIRYYTKMGLLRPARTPGNGYKVFEQADISRFHFIRQAQSLGCTLVEIREILDQSQQSEPDCGRIRNILHDRLVKNQQRLLELSQLQKRIQKALAFCELASVNYSNEDLLRHLIECVGATPPQPKPLSKTSARLVRSLRKSA